MDEGADIYRCHPHEQGADAVQEFVHIALEVERWQAMRGHLAHWLAWLGLPLWAIAARPGLLGGSGAHLVVGLWGMVGGLYLYVGSREWAWRRRRARYRVEPDPSGDPPP